MDPFSTVDLGMHRIGRLNGKLVDLTMTPQNRPWKRDHFFGLFLVNHPNRAPITYQIKFFSCGELSELKDLCMGKMEK